jgi:hypothetical protein
MMRRQEIERLIEAANPVDREAVAKLPLGEAKRELYKAIVAEHDEEPATGGAHERSTRRPQRSRRAYLALGACALATVAAITAGVITGPSGSGTALAAARDRLVRVSPHLLLEAPGWQMQAAEQTGPGEGKIEFAADDFEQHGFLRGRLQVQTQSVARLSWQPQRSARRSWLRLRAAAAVHTAEVPGATALFHALNQQLIPGVDRRHERDLGLRADRSFSAIWRAGGWHLRFDSTAPSAPAFAQLLESLRTVSGRIWLRRVPRPMRLIGGRPVAGTPLSELQIAFHCRPVPAPLAAREDPAVVAYFRQECPAQ